MFRRLAERFRELEERRQSRLWNDASLGVGEMEVPAIVLLEWATQSGQETSGELLQPGVGELDTIGVAILVGSVTVTLLEDIELAVEAVARKERKENTHQGLKQNS